MRFLNGLLGSFAALCLIAILFTSIQSGDSADLVTVGVINLVIAAIAAGVIALAEKPTWGWTRYAVAGVYTAGSVLFIGTLALLAVIADAFGSSLSTVPFTSWAMIAIVTAISGAITGIGYRVTTGVKAAA